MPAAIQIQPESESSLTSVTWLLEQIIRDYGDRADRSVIRQALEEADASGRSDDDSWWQWINEAAQSLSLKCRTVDCTPEQLPQLLSPGVTVLLRSNDAAQWIAVREGKRRSVTIMEPGVNRARRSVAMTSLANELHRFLDDSLLRVVVLERFVTTTGDASHEHERTPYSRLLALLRAERSDIWVVLTFALMSGLLGMTTPLAVEALVNTVAFGRFLQPVVVLSLMLLAFLIFQGALKTLQTFVVEIIQRRLFARIAADLSFRLPRTQLRAFDGVYAPELVNRFFDVVTVQKVTASLLLDGVSLVLNAFVGMTVLAFYHPYLLAFDVVLILLMLFTVFVLGRGAIKTSIKESKTKYAMASWLEDLARCRTTFRGQGAAEFALGRSDRLVFDYLTARKKHFRVLVRQIIALLLIQALASTALLAIGGLLVISGQLSLGQLVAAELIVAVVVSAFAKMSKHMESFYDLMAALDKLGVLMDLPMERQDGLLSMPSDAGATVELKNVSCHTANNRQVLSELSVNLADGEHSGVSGPSGSGKSLVLDLLYGLRKPDSGAVLIDGVSVHDLRPDVLRRRVALARDVEVFDGTIAENIHLERPDINAADVTEALEIVGLLDAVRNLPDGVDTQLAQDGSPLTMSLQRRLMLARLVAGSPALLLIDELLDGFPDEEATSLLDAFVSSSHRWTILLVSCRPNLLARLPRVVQLKQAS